MEDIEQLIQEIKELRESVEKLHERVGSLDSTMIGIAGLGSDELVGAIKNLTAALQKRA